MQTKVTFDRTTELQLADLFREAGKAHHLAFASTNGEDPGWPAWYAAYLGPRLQQLLGGTFDPAQLEADLKALDGEHRMTGGQVPWHEFYARMFHGRGRAT